jgi:hypothetical protein
VSSVPPLPVREESVCEWTGWRDRLHILYDDSNGFAGVPDGGKDVVLDGKFWLLISVSPFWGDALRKKTTRSFNQSKSC